MSALNGTGPEGVLFLVATPIGNLEDITLRAIRVLREADLIAAEDTRHTAKLLHHYGIHTPTTSLHEHNEAVRAGTLVARLAGGARVALVSDAGTPGVSDPGFRVVRAAIDAGVRVESIPGPCAALAALVCSGLPTDAFVFLGFPPARAQARTAWLDRLRDETRTIVFYEAPHRIRACLTSALAVLGDRPVAVARELTKIHEELVRGPISAVLAKLGSPRGEFTVVLAGLDKDAATADAVQPPDTQILTEFELLLAEGRSRRDAISTIARRSKLRAREVYAAVERARIS